LTTEEIVQKCADGDRKAQKALYDLYARMVLRTVMNYISDRDSAMDVVHDSFMKIFRNISSFESEKTLESWIRTVAINTSIDFLRKAKKLEYFEGDHDTITQQTTENTAELVAHNELIRQVELLPDGAKCILNLYAVEGYNHREIAEMLNISVGTSKSQLSRARQLLVQILNPANRHA
jgi:RNA polymerase sigma factor (sigma-70 family)